jgi:hypothetical protein
LIARPRKGSRAPRKSKTAPSSEGYRRLLRWAALPITDRRWAAPLSAVALGFGLFVGVAIGPGAAGTFATGAAQIIEIPGFTASTEDGGEEESEARSPSTPSGGGEGSIPAAESGPIASTPIFTAEGGEETTESTPTPQSSPAAEKPEPEPEPEAETLAGIVLHVNPAAGSYTLVEPEGTLDVVHAAKAPQPGTKLSVPTRLLANGTFAEAGTRARSGTRTRASFGGIVTYVDPTPTAPAYTVSKRGASVLVHVHPDPTGAAPTLPALGAFATVAVEIEKVPPVASTSDAPPAPGEEPAPPSEPAPVPSPAPAPAAESPPAPAPPTCAPDSTQPPPPTIQPSAIIWQRQVSAAGAPFTYSDFSGIIEAICPESSQLLISADDIRESGHDLVFTVPAEIDTTKLEVGQSVVATANIATDGGLTLTGLASDERTKGADDAKAAQGDLISSKPNARGRVAFVDGAQSAKFGD